ncbi:MAG: hypothetical protein LBI82_10265 [Dysgonamonadaceae bacterium]|jgi:hypothetical protein|nr:hypothetical protein [Dysgonamonadaceae bacterium]
MRCKQCGQYIPEGLEIKQCFCGFELQEDSFQVENELITNESKTVEEKVQIKTELLTRKQKERVNGRIEQEQKGLLAIGCFYVIMIIVTFIPLYSRRGRDLGGLSAMEFFGYIPTTLFLIIVGAIIFFFTIRWTKYFKLKKDLEEKQSITILTKVSYISGDAKKGYEVFLEKNEANIPKVFFEFYEFPQIKKGDFVELTLTPNAHLVLSIVLDAKPTLKRDFRVI